MRNKEVKRWGGEKVRDGGRWPLIALTASRLLPASFSDKCGQMRTDEGQMRTNEDMENAVFSKEMRKRGVPVSLKKNFSRGADR
jgi:hypothetical protein